MTRGSSTSGETVSGSLSGAVEVLYQPFPIPGAARGHIWHHVPETRRPRHFHAEPELNLIAAGSAKFGVGEAVVSVTAGDLLWWPPGQDHVLLEASLDFDLYVIGVTPDFSERVLGSEKGVAMTGAAHLRLDALHLASCDQAQEWPLCTNDKRMRQAAERLNFSMTADAK